MSAAMHQLPAQAPRAVRLAFDSTAEDPDTRTRCLGVEIRDARRGDLLGALRLKEAAAWLQAHGYRYACGANGVWVRQ